MYLPIGKLGFEMEVKGNAAASCDSVPALALRPSATGTCPSFL